MSPWSAQVAAKSNLANLTHNATPLVETLSKDDDDSLKKQ